RVTRHRRLMAREPDRAGALSAVVRRADDWRSCDRRLAAVRPSQPLRGRPDLRRSESLAAPPPAAVGPRRGRVTASALPFRRVLVYLGVRHVDTGVRCTSTPAWIGPGRRAPYRHTGGRSNALRRVPDYRS